MVLMNRSLPAPVLPRTSDRNRSRGRTLVEVVRSITARPLLVLAVILALTAVAPAHDGPADADVESLDIEVVSLELVDPAYGPGKPIRIEAVVANNGPQPIGPVTLSIFLNGNKLDESIIPELAPETTESVVVPLVTPPEECRLNVALVARPALSLLHLERTPNNNAKRLALHVVPDQEQRDRGRVRSVMWLTEPLYVVDAPYRLEPGLTEVPLLVLILSELPNESGWNPDLDSFNEIRCWVNGTDLGRLENAFTASDTRFWYRIYRLPIAHFNKINDFNLIRVNLDRSWADDRGPDIQPQNSAWGAIKDPMNNDPLDNATWVTDGDYWYCRVYRSSHALPNIDAGHWFYGDTHVHTVYTDNSAEIGSPIDATADAAEAIGLSWLAVTDHSNDLDSDEDAENFKDGLPHPPFDRPQPQSTTAKWADFLGEVAKVNAAGRVAMIVGAEVNFVILQADFPQVPDDIFAHTLVLGLESVVVPIPGEGQDGMSLISPIGKSAEEGASGNIPPSNTSVYNASRLYGDTLAMWELLDMLQSAHPGCAVFLAHPYKEFSPGSASWSFLLQRNPWHQTTNGDFVYEPGVSASYAHPLFKGFQIWNGQPGYGNGIGKDDTQVLEGMLKYDSILQQDLIGFDPTRKLFIIGGSDAHGDFCSHTSRGELYNWDILQKRRDLTNVLGKVRTAVYIPNGQITPQSALDALIQGRAVVTNGPMAVFGVVHSGQTFLPGDHLTVPRSQLKGMKIAIRWATTPEFGPYTTIGLKAIGPTTIKTPITINNPANTGTRVVTIQSTLPGYTGWYALRLEATTDPSQALFQEPQLTYPYRCYTNPIWLNITEG